MKAMASVAMAGMLAGVSPELAPTPALSNRITSRSCASPSVTAGSQWSMVPRKWMFMTIGRPPVLPKRRYAKRIPLASANRVGAVSWVQAAMVVSSS